MWIRKWGAAQSDRPDMLSLCVQDPKKPLVLTNQEREKLAQWARRPKTAQRLALRSRIVLSCGEGFSNQVVAQQCGVSTHAVSKWRERFRPRRDNPFARPSSSTTSSPARLVSRSALASSLIDNKVCCNLFIAVHLVGTVFEFLKILITRPPARRSVLSAFLESRILGWSE